MSKEAKLIRGQIRQITEELLTKEMIESIKKELDKKIEERLAELSKSVRDQMHEMNERHKDTMGYLVRQVSVPVKKD